MEWYQDKKVVIIGGTSGMGLATAKMLLDGRARVLVTGRSQAGLDSARRELADGAIVVSSDARSLTDIDALAAQVKTEFDTFDLLFVNAGFSIPTPLESVTEAIYDEMFNLNAKGPFFAVQKLAPLINRGGAVVLTTSVANVKGMPGQATYGAAKAALRNFARVLAAELLPREIRVKAVSPGPIDTGILEKAFPYVFITGRRQAELDKAVAEIDSNVTAVEADISKLDDLDRFYETVAKKGKIDVIFAGAAFVEKQMTATATPEHFDKTFNTNARGTYFTVQKALPYLNDGASIILVAAAGKKKGLPGRSTYSATKAAIRSYARTSTSELKDRKIRINALSPEAVDTPMFDDQYPSGEGAAEARKQITAMTPLARLARPEEIASAALFLASDLSSYVAGIDLPVDGGLTAV